MSHLYSHPQFLLSVIPAAALACGGGNALGIPPTTGALEITTLTTGAEPDPDGYSVHVDSEPPQAISPAAPLQLTEVAEGPHTIQLAGVAANCTVSGDNPRTVTISAGDTTVVGFAVECEATAKIDIEWLWTTGLELGNPFNLSDPNARGSVLRTTERAHSGAYSLKFTVPSRIMHRASIGSSFSFDAAIHVVDLWFYLPVVEGANLEFEVAMEGWSGTQRHLASFQWVRNDSLNAIGWRRWAGGHWVYLPGGQGRTLSEGAWHQLRCEVDYVRNEYRKLTIDGVAFPLNGLRYDLSPFPSELSAYHVSILLWSKTAGSLSAFVDDIRVGKAVLRKG